MPNVETTVLIYLVIIIVVSTSETEGRRLLVTFCMFNAIIIKYRGASDCVGPLVAGANHKPKPLVWSQSTDAFLAAVQRGRQALEAIH